jgi:hypothetical protein
MEMDTAAIQRAYELQAASRRHLYRHHLLFKLQHQRWFRLHRDRVLVADFEVNTDGQRIGLFAEPVWLLHALWYAESIGARPFLRITSSSYSRAGDGHSDYLQHFFSPQWPAVSMAESFVIRKRISSLSQLPNLETRTAGLNLWRANALVRAYLPLHQSIIDESNCFLREHLGSSYLAVHWRGTDKHLEAEPVSIESMAQQIRRVYESLDVKPSHLFVASDQQVLVDQLAALISRQIPELRCVWRKQIIRSLDTNPIHLRSGLEGDQRVRLGREALVDALILSQSRALIRTASFLSAWSSIWNPTLPVFMVNAPHASKCWFPDSEILLASSYHHSLLRRNYE